MTAEGSFVTLESGLTLSLLEVGDPSGPAVLLLPGPTDSWRSYETVLEHLPRSLRVIAVSQRGHGDSGKPASGYGVRNFAADVPPLLDALGIERAAVTGHSGSCLVARRVAIDHPERVAGLVLEASPSTLVGNPNLRQFVESLTDLRDPIDPAFARSVIIDTASEDLAPELIDELAGDLMKVPAGVWREMFTDLLTYDDIDELGSIAAPTLLVWGDADGLVDRSMQDRLLERLPVAELRVYSGVGHTPRWEDPARFAADLNGFVQRQPH